MEVEFENFPVLIEDYENSLFEGEDEGIVSFEGSRQIYDPYFVRACEIAGSPVVDLREKQEIIPLTAEEIR